LRGRRDQAVTLSLLRRGAEPLRIGHRGAPALAPENTIASFERALELGVDGVELDVVCADSGRLVVCHDQAGSGPALDEVLGLLAGRDTLVQLDLKSVGAESQLIDALRRFDLLDRAVVSSFRPESLRSVAAIEPALARSFTYPEDRFGLSSRRWPAPAIRAGVAVARRVLPRRVDALLSRAQAFALTLHVSLAGREVITACHTRGAAVWVWTVNDGATAARVSAAGADAIITDDPRIFRAA
jgi:glycerophosphoryl diester phosphodiesterase